MTRPVMVFEYFRPEGSTVLEKREIGAGNFHQFGVDHEDYQDGPGNFSTAIVEMPDGTIKNVPVEMIRFDDDGGNPGEAPRKAGKWQT